MTPRTTPSDNDLVRRLRDGEGDAAASLRARHWASVFDFALRMTASVETAQSIADEVFASVVTSPPGDDERFAAWAFAAAHRKVMALPNRLHADLGELDDDVEVVVDLRDDARPIDAGLAGQVWDAVTRLDRGTQAVIDLHLRQGLAPSELAPLLGISVNDAAEVVQHMKRTAADTIAVQLLRGDEQHSCSGLDEAVASQAARDHVDDCEACVARKTERYPPLQILGALRVVPSVPPEPVAATPSTGVVSRRRRLATPLGVLAMLAGSVAFVLVGALVWDGVIQPLGERVIDVVRSNDPEPTTLPPTTVVAAPAPAASGDRVQMDEDTAVEIPVLDNDGPDAAGTITIATQPENGTATVIGPQILYRPNRDFNGADEFTYSLTDPDGATSTAPVVIDVTPVDDAPEIVRVAAIEAVEDEPIMVDISDWVTDADGDSIEIVARDDASDGGGSVTDDLLFTPAADFNGVDSFVVTVTDGTTELTFPILVSIAAVNDPPVGPSRLTLGTEEDQTGAVAPLDGWSDADGDELVVLLPDATSEAGADIRFASGELLYEPPRDFFGADRFTYRISDGTEPVTVVVDVTITPIPDAPTVTRASFSIDENDPRGSLVGTLRAADPEGDVFSFSLGQPTAPVSISASGRVELTQTLDHEATDQIQVSAIVQDATGASRRFDLVVSVRDVDEAPTGRDQQILVTPFAAKGTNIARVAVTDPEGQALTYAELNGDPAGAVSVTKSGMVRTSRQADPQLYPITLAVEATDPGGQSTTVLVVVRLDDFVGPTVGQVSVSEDTVWELRADGRACPRGPSRSDIAVAVSDSSGIASATIEWSAVFDGVPLNGQTRMAVKDGMATGSFTFGSGLVERGGESLLTASIVVVDRAGNRTSSDPFTIIVKSCSNP